MLRSISFAPTLGAIVGPNGTTVRTWAPAQKAVTLVLENDRQIKMAAIGEGFFETVVPDVQPGQRYWFQLGEGRRADPASRFQPEGPLGPSQVVDPHAFHWTDDDWQGAPPVHQNVLYEMHLGTFTGEGTWKAAAERLAFLADLGITTLEIMPIAEFAGDFGWGYDGVNFFAPSHLYGTPDDVRHFINAAHHHRLAVILDVVYNHFGPVGNFLRDFAPMFFGKPGEWGDSINYDGPDAGPVRAFMIENAAYWIAEYHFDGLRFDATQGINDSSPQHIIADMCAAARVAAGSRRVYLVGESEPQDVRLLRSSNVYHDGLDAIWNEDWHHSAFVALTGRREGYFNDYLGTASEFAAMARHGTLYQGQWYSWQKQPRGGYALNLPSARFVAFLENHDQVANTGLGGRLYEQSETNRWRAMTTLLLAGPHTPMLFQGHEFASSAPFTYFAHHEEELAEAVQKGRLEFMRQFPALATPEMQKLLPAPHDVAGFRNAKLRWEEQSRQPWAGELVRDLLALRANDAVLSRLGTPEVTVESAAQTETVLLLRYMSQSGHRLIVVNIGRDYRCPMNHPLFAPAPGMEWQMLFSSDHPAYGGQGAVPIGGPGPWHIRGNSAMIFALAQIG